MKNNTSANYILGFQHSKKNKNNKKQKQQPKNHARIKSCKKSHRSRNVPVSNYEIWNNCYT